MSVPLLGLVLIPVGVWLLLARPALLPAAVVFFVPFSATAVLVYWGRESPHWMPVVDFFGILWIASLAGRALADGRVALPLHRGMTLPLLAGFVCVAIASLVMPVLIDGTVSIQSANPLDGGVAFPLFFRLNHLIVLWDLLFGVLLALAIASYCASPSGLEATLRVTVWSSLFISAWGLLEYASYYIGFYFPYTFFNNNPTEDPLELARVLRGDLVVKRITSVSAEPSFLAQALLALLPLVLFAVWSRRPIVSRTVDRCAAGLMILTLLLSTSVSAYVGLAVVSLASMGALIALRRISLRPIAAWGVLIAGLALVYAQSATVREFVDTYVLGKSVSASGVERLFTTLNAWSYFRDYPILGLGWGSVPSHDLLTYLLANSGVCGLAAFGLFLGYVLVRLERTLRSPRHAPAPDWLRYRLAGIGVALITLVVVGALAGFPFEYGHVWLVLGLAMGATSAVRTESTASTVTAALG